MTRFILFFCGLYIMTACSPHGIAKSINDIPSCLDATIKRMASDPREGSPISVTRYTYKEQTVYYLISPCCDKFNVVYDSLCNIIGYPDGGYTGKGDGKMTDFHTQATDKKIIWEKNNRQ